LGTYPIEDIEGIGTVFAARLRAAGIGSTTQLLAACGSAKGREQTAAATSLSEKQLLKWTNMADLMRIKGVGEEFSELLEAAGVDTVKELKHRIPENLAARMAEVNAKRKLTRRVPTVEQVGEWVAQAGVLEPAISY
jgi:predicted flap endonuclease-1-like 5' DNA nuclease